MGNLLKKELEDARTEPKRIRDPRGNELFEQAKSVITDSSSAMAKYSEADEKRIGTTREIHEAAYIYLALAFRLAKNSSIRISVNEKAFNADHMFHFAGHAFREIGQLNRAADAYWRAGVLGSEGSRPTDMAIRSLARAKTGFADIGEIDKSDRMHRLEWEARGESKKGLTGIWIGLWNVTSHYGSSASRWCYWTCGFILVFSMFYEILHAMNLIHQSQPWTFGVTALYYTLVTTTTLGYGEFVPNHVLAQLVVILNIILAYFLLGIGLTIVGRIAMRR